MQADWAENTTDPAGDHAAPCQHGDNLGTLSHPQNREPSLVDTLANEGHAQMAAKQMTNMHALPDTKHSLGIQK